MCSHATRSLHLVRVRTSWEEKKNVKKEQITGWLSLLRSICRPIVRTHTLSFCLFLLPFIVLVCQLYKTTVQTEKRKRKDEEEERACICVCAWVRWTSFMLRACYTNSKEEAALTVYITWKANRNNNNNNRCVKNNKSTVAYCARSRVRARWDVSIFLRFFSLLSFLSFLSLPRQRTEKAAPNAKEQKMENILHHLPLLLRSHHKAFFSQRCRSSTTDTTKE